MEKLKALANWLFDWLFEPPLEPPFHAVSRPPGEEKTATSTPSVPEPLSSPTPPPAPTVPVTVPESEVLRFDTPKRAYHSTRVICDQLGLTLVQKNQVCACIFQESRFKNDAVCYNRDKNGEVWSRDIGIVQVNTYFHIGKGKTFPSEQYVLDNPEKMVHWMAGIMKKTSGLQPWSSWTSGAYRQWLVPSSPMWALKS